MACIIVSSPDVGGDGGDVSGMVGTTAGNRGDSGDGMGCGCAAAASAAAASAAASGVSSFSEIETGDEGRDKASCSSTRGVA